MAAQEPAFMVLNNVLGATESPLFQDAVKDLKKTNPEIVKATDQEMAALIFTLEQHEAIDELK